MEENENVNENINENKNVSSSQQGKVNVVKKEEFKNIFFLITKAIILLGILLLTIQKNYFIYYKPQAIIGLIVGFSFFISVFRKSDFTAPISALLLIGFLETVDLHLWKYPPFSYMFTIEDFSGVYKGNKISKVVRIVENDNYGSKSTEYSDPSEFTLRIHQTGSKISIHSFSYKNDKDKIHESKSDMVIIRDLENEGEYELIYCFNDVGTPKKGRYSGTAHLNIRYIDDSFSMEGGFYTNRDPQTRGNFTELKNIGEDSPNPFNSYRYLQN